jgi:hypothetical protein
MMKESSFTRIGRHVLQDKGRNWHKVIASVSSGQEASQLLRLLRRLERNGRRRQSRKETPK